MRVEIAEPEFPKGYPGTYTREETMKKWILTGLLILGAGAVFAGSPAWSQDHASALAEAKESNKHVLVNFSGSDWCKWCIKLDEEVFTQEAFQEYAAENLVLLLIDTPAHKKLDETTVEQNQSLKDKYGIRGFPTILLLNPSGTMIAQTGYQFGGAEKYVAHLKGLIESHAKLGE